MARIDVNEAAERAKGSGNGFDFKFLSLKDREVKRVRFLCETINDIDSFTVHQVRGTDNKMKTINCLRERANEPLQNCPLCEKGEKLKARIYLIMVSEDAQDKGEIIVWERSGAFVDKMESLITRYTQDGRKFYQNIFEIERRGNGLDTNYEIYQCRADETKKEELPMKPELFGRLVLDKNRTDIEAFLSTGQFPDTEQPVNKNDNSTVDYRPRQQEPAQPRREYTPAGKGW